MHIITFDEVDYLAQNSGTYTIRVDDGKSQRGGLGGGGGWRWGEIGGETAVGEIAEETNKKWKSQVELFQRRADIRPGKHLMKHGNRPNQLRRSQEIKQHDKVCTDSLLELFALSPNRTSSHKLVVSVTAHSPYLPVSP